MRAFVVAIFIVAAPAAAETWDCELAVRCVTGYDCEPTKGETERLVIAPDGVTATSTGSGGTGTFRKISETTVRRTYMAEFEGGSAIFFSLFGDGAVVISGHVIDGTDVSAAAIEGSCERSEG